MNSARYLIAKYVPDLFRNEPRNIGIILWTPFGVRAKFLGSNSNGHVDGRKVRDLVSSHHTYSQWIKMWYESISRLKLEYIGKGKFESNDTPKFLDALMTTSGGNYILENGGQFFEEVNAENLGSAVDFLYKNLVKEDIEESDSMSSLNYICNRIIERSGLVEDPLFKTEKIVPCSFGDATRDYKFSYYYGNGTPNWLAQKVELPARMGNIEKTIESLAWRFNSVISSGIIQKNKGLALIYPEDNQMQMEGFHSLIEELKFVAKVVDVRDEDTAIKEIKSLVAASPRH